MLAATRQRNRPVRGWVQGSQPRRAEREVDPSIYLDHAKDLLVDVGPELTRA